MKQLLPIYDKPLIYYPISVLLLTDIRDILIITAPRDAATFFELLGNGSRFGVNITYAVQASPDGIAQAFIIGREFIGNDPTCLILGDNFFFGHNLEAHLNRANHRENGASIFTYHVRDPERYGVAELDIAGHPIKLHEKPKVFKSNYAITGLYFYDNKVVDIATSIKRSARGEFEITDINQAYLDMGQLECIRLGRGFSWLDAGTPDSLLEAAQFVQTIEKRQGLRIACLEEIAFRKGFISLAELENAAKYVAKSDYGQYLLKIAQEAADKHAV